MVLRHLLPCSIQLKEERYTLLSLNGSVKYYLIFCYQNVDLWEFANKMSIDLPFLV